MNKHKNADLINHILFYIVTMRFLNFSPSTSNHGTSKLEDKNASVFIPHLGKKKHTNDSCPNLVLFGKSKFYNKSSNTP